MVDTLNLNLVPDDSEEEFIVDFGEVINVGGGGTSDFNELTNRPKYDGQTMTGDTDIPKVPTTTSDLENTSDYQTGTEVQTAISTAIAGKQDTLTAGDNITIQNNVISATDTTYTAGNAITIENNTINADIYPADYFTAGGTITGTGSSFTLDKTIPATLKSVKPCGNTEQDGTPTPDAPVDIHVVTGTQTVTITGKNLFLLPESGEKNNITFTNNGDESFSISSSAAASATANFTRRYSKTFIGQTGDSVVFTISTNKPLPTGCNAYLTARSDNAYLQDLADLVGDGTRTSATQTRTLEAGITILEVVVRVTSGSTVDISDVTVQAEIGATPTDYEPYQSQTFTLNLGSTELCKIGDYQDYIYKSGDYWYVHKAVDKVVLDGSNDEAWGISNSGTPNFFYCYQYLINAKTPADGVSNIALKTGINSSNTNQGFDYIDTGELRIRYGTEMSISDWRTQLGTTNMILYYPLAEPVDVGVIDSLARQLDALAEAKSYLGITNFIVTASDINNLPAILDVEAYRNSAEGVALREPKIPEVIDDLESSSTKDALSANQGRVLRNIIGNVEQTAFDAYDIRYITGDMEPNWPEEEPDGFRIEIFEPNRIYYTDASAPVKIYYSDTDSIDNFIGYIQNEIVEDNPEDEPPTTTYGFKLTQMNGADNTPEIYVGQSSINLNDNELTSLSFEQVGAGGGGSPYNVYSTVTTSNSNRGGAIYLGNLNASQEQFADPTTSDTHKRYIHILPYSNTTQPASNSIILGSELTSSSSSGSIGLGFSASIEASNVINIGGQYGRGQYSVIIGPSASSQRSDSQYNVLLGYSSTINTSAVNGSVGIGAYSHPTASGQIHVGSTNTSFGYNNTNYRIISGVHDGQGLNDAATVAQGNTLATSAPTTSTVGVLGQLYTDTTTMHTYQLGAIDNTDPANPVYTWVQRW